MYGGLAEGARRSWRPYGVFGERGGGPVLGAEEIASGGCVGVEDYVRDLARRPLAVEERRQLARGACSGGRGRWR